jgi:hypothetical protein
MDQQLRRATPDLAKAVWSRQQSPSARSVARALTRSGRPVHFTTVNRWRAHDWRDAKGQHPLDQARAALESALPLMTLDPTSTIDDLVRNSPERQQLDELSDGELLRRTAREVAMADDPSFWSARGMNSFVGGYPIPHFKQAKPISLSL